MGKFFNPPRIWDVGSAVLQATRSLWFLVKFIFVNMTMHVRLIRDSIKLATNQKIQFCDFCDCTSSYNASIRCSSELYVPSKRSTNSIHELPKLPAKSETKIRNLCITMFMKHWLFYLKSWRFLKSVGCVLWIWFFCLHGALKERTAENHIYFHSGRPAVLLKARMLSPLSKSMSFIFWKLAFPNLYDITNQEGNFPSFYAVKVSLFQVCRTSLPNHPVKNVAAMPARRSFNWDARLNFNSTLQKFISFHRWDHIFKGHASYDFFVIFSASVLVEASKFHKHRSTLRNPYDKKAWSVFA